MTGRETGNASLKVYGLGLVVTIAGGVVNPFIAGSFVFFAIAGSVCFVIPIVARIWAVVGAGESRWQLLPIPATAFAGAFGLLGLTLSAWHRFLWSPPPTFDPAVARFEWAFAAPDLLLFAAIAIVVILAAMVLLKTFVVSGWLVVTAAVAGAAAWLGYSWVGAFRIAIVAVALAVIVGTAYVALQYRLEDLHERQKPLALLGGAGAITLIDLVTVVQGLSGVLDHCPTFLDMARLGFAMSAVSVGLLWTAAILLARIRFQRGGMAHAILAAGAGLGLGSTVYYVLLEGCRYFG